eukprot:SAG11_NODE_157_length_14147_cov_8.545202_11_plen_71_part_00
MRMVNAPWFRLMLLVRTPALGKGLPKTVSGGVNTVLATLVGVLCFGSRLSGTNCAGIAMASGGTWLCTRG